MISPSLDLLLDFSTSEVPVVEDVDVSGVSAGYVKSVYGAIWLNSRIFLEFS